MSHPAMPPLHVLQFAEVVNRYDFIDTIVRFADPAAFRFSVATFRPANIQDPEYEPGTASVLRFPTPGSRMGYLPLLGRLARAVDAHGVDVIHAHHFYEAVLAVWASRISRRSPPVVFGRHYDDKFYITLSGLKRRRYLAWDRWLCRSVDHIVVPTGKIRSLIEGQQATHAPMDVIPYGFDFSAERYRPLSAEEARKTRDDLGVGDGRLVVNVGRHHVIKGQDDLLHATARLREAWPGLRVVLVGDGPAHADLRALSHGLGLDDVVTFTGWSRAVRSFVGAADLVVFPTLQEAFPQAMFEAMSLARAVVTTPVSGTEGVLVPGGTGFLTPVRDPEALASVMGEALTDPERLRAVGDAARRHVVERFSAPSVVGRYADVYRRVSTPGRERS